MRIRIANTARLRRSVTCWVWMRAFNRLAEMPRMGRSIDYVRIGYFRFEHARHAIFYVILKGGIRIVRVLHASMDPQRHLSE